MPINFVHYLVDLRMPVGTCTDVVYSHIMEQRSQLIISYRAECGK